MTNNGSVVVPTLVVDVWVIDQGSGAGGGDHQRDPIPPHGT